MPRPPAKPATKLGRAIQGRRGDSTLREAADVVGVADNTLSRLERGAHRPSLRTAMKLAAWLNWSVEEVVEAAETPVDTSGEEDE